jgi:hypothetical protein
MGSYFSQEQDHYLKQFSNPLVSEHTRAFMVKCVWNGDQFIFSKDNPFSCLVSDKVPNQYVVILDIFVTYIQSDLKDEDVTLCISNLFEDINEDVSENRVVIFCPKNADYSVQGNDQIVYKARNLPRDFVGFEDIIMEAKMGDTFLKNHPVQVIADQMGIVLNSEENLRKIQRSFAVYSVHKTRFDETRCTAIGHGTMGKGVCVMLKMKYLLVSPGETKFKIKELK